jgi:hypothetical protein
MRIFISIVKALWYLLLIIIKNVAIAVKTPVYIALLDLKEHFKLGVRQFHPRFLNMKRGCQVEN